VEGLEVWLLNTQQLWKRGFWDGLHELRRSYNNYFFYRIRVICEILMKSAIITTLETRILRWITWISRIKRQLPFKICEIHYNPW